MKRFLYTILFFSGLSYTAQAQILAVDPKGTRVTIDSSKWTISGSDIYNKNSGNVGVGNPTPAYKLDVSGKVRITDSLLVNSARVQSINSGSLNDSIVVIDPNTGLLKRISSTRLNKTDSTTASNGLTLTGKDVRLGGNLSSATTISNNSNALTIATGGSALNVTGLTAGSTTDSLLTINTTTGRINRVTPNIINRADSTTASNGLTLIGKDVRLGGSLNAASTITTTAANTLAIAGLQSGTSNDSLVAIDPATNIIKRISSARLDKTDSTTASNGLTLTGKDVRLGGSLNAASTITTTAVNTLAIAGLQSGTSNDSIVVANGSTGVLARISSSRLTGTANNGLTKTVDSVQLGGSLTKATTITTTASNTLAIAGLQSGSLNDSVLMITSGNVIRRINATSVAKEPFNVVGGTTQATSNTQDIYTQGNVSVGKTSNTATLEVGGKIKADSNISAPSFSSTYQDFGSVGGTINWNLQSGATAGVRLTSNGTLSITNVAAGMYGLIRVTQDGIGGRTLNLPAGSRVINGGSGSVSLTQTANSVDLLSFFYDGTNYWWTIGNNYN